MTSCGQSRPSVIDRTFGQFVLALLIDGAGGPYGFLTWIAPKKISQKSLTGT
jgi:hypothetical protein